MRLSADSRKAVVGVVGGVDVVVVAAGAVVVVSIGIVDGAIADVVVELSAEGEVQAASTSTRATDLSHIPEIY